MQVHADVELGAVPDEDDLPVAALVSIHHLPAPAGPEAAAVAAAARVTAARAQAVAVLAAAEGARARAHGGGGGTRDRGEGGSAIAEAEVLHATAFEAGRRDSAFAFPDTVDAVFVVEAEESDSGSDQGGFAAAAAVGDEEPDIAVLKSSCG